MYQHERSDEYGELQRVVDHVFERTEEVSRLDVVVIADAFDLCADLRHIVELLPPGMYTRVSLCSQLNSAIAGHVWGMKYGTVE